MYGEGRNFFLSKNKGLYTPKEASQRADHDKRDNKSIWGVFKAVLGSESVEYGGGQYDPPALFLGLLFMAWNWPPGLLDFS